jgi:galactokinase
LKGKGWLMSIRDAGVPTAAIQETRALFRRHYGHTPTHLVSAPGRLELLGNHTDYNQGLVMALAVDRFIHLAASPRPDGRIELVSSAFPAKESFFSSSKLAKNPSAPWADYVKGVLVHLRQRGAHFPGFNAAIHGTIPPGAGMSSSAALEVATALMVRQLMPYTLTATGITRPPPRNDDGSVPRPTAAEKLEIARLCQQAENQFVGVNCGILDPISSLFGKAFHAMEIDCQSNSVETVPMIGEIAIVVCHTGVRHELVGGQYNTLRAHCESAALALGVKSLRAVDPPMLKANRSRLTVREYECAWHIAGEIQRVIFGARALREADFPQFGQYLFQSHQSSRDFFHNSCRELDLLVELAQLQPSCLGARLTGGGFGGATVNLVMRPHLAEFCQAMAAAYEKNIGVRIEPMICQVVDGAG